LSIRICIVEDDPIIRGGLVEVIRNSESCDLLDAFETAEELIGKFRELQPDVVLMDIQLPGRSGIECVRELKIKSPKTQFLIISVFEDNENIFDALCAGATGYLLKSTDSQKLIQSIKDIYRGESPMSGTIARKVIGNFQNQKKSSDYLNLLSEREREILDYLSRGFRYKEIAGRVSLSVETVRTHIHNIYEKLQVSSRTDALNKVFEK
jgi:DNA-binding NarL/FixJ family response regulator